MSQNYIRGNLVAPVVWGRVHVCARVPACVCHWPPPQCEGCPLSPRARRLVTGPWKPFPSLPPPPQGSLLLRPVKPSPPPWKDKRFWSSENWGMWAVGPSSLRVRLHCRLARRPSLPPGCSISTVEADPPPRGNGATSPPLSLACGSQAFS